MRPPELVDLATFDGVRLDIGYARADNFTGAVVPGYEAPGAWLLRPAAEALRHVLETLARERLGLVVYDAYRPRRAAHAMADWCAAHAPELLRGYIARESRHSRAIAIDVGLVHRESGALLPMGTAWDTFSPASWFATAVGAARVNRRTLRDAMSAHGFVPYDREWWHFEHASAPLPPVLDVPYAD